MAFPHPSSLAFVTSGSRGNRLLFYTRGHKTSEQTGSQFSGRYLTTMTLSLPVSLPLLPSSLLLPPSFLPHLPPSSLLTSSLLTSSLLPHLPPPFLISVPPRPLPPSLLTSLLLSLPPHLPPSIPPSSHPFLNRHKICSVVSYTLSTH